MSGHVVDVRGKRRRHAIVVSIGLLAALAGSVLILRIVDRVREATDRTH